VLLIVCRSDACLDGCVACYTYTHPPSIHNQADPTADVEGHDVRAKICILAKLAFGVTVDPMKVPCQGISQITSTDFEYAKLMGCTVKLVGTAARLSKYGAYNYKCIVQ